MGRNDRKWGKTDTGSEFPGQIDPDSVNVWSSKLRENDERKNTLVGRICALSDRNKRLLAIKIIFYYFSEKLVFESKICPYSHIQDTHMTI